MEAATRKGMKYDFTHFVIICKQQRLAPLDPKSASSRSSWETVFVNAEEEFFCEVCIIEDFILWAIQHVCCKYGNFM